MNTKPNRGDEPAMPTQYMDFQPSTGIQVVREQTFGLTIREHFAGLAMQGLLSDPNRNGTNAQFAYSAVKMADALISELAKEGKV